MTNHVMIDLETMGTRPGSAIVSIGAVVFNPVAGRMGAEFYSDVTLQSALDAGLTVDGGTVAWWLGQGEDARQAVAKAQGHIVSALGGFAQFYSQNRAGPIWGHGGNFDEPLLAEAFRRAAVRQPWQFWDARCTRTIYALANERPDRAKGVHHNALDDARAQAEAVIRSYAKLGLATGPAALEAVAGRLA